MWVVECTPIFVIVSSAQPTKSFGKSRNGKPSRRTRSLETRWGLCLTLTCIKNGSLRLNLIGFDRSMTFIFDALLCNDPVGERAHAVDPDLNRVALRKEMPCLNAAAAGERSRPEELAWIEPLRARCVRKYLPEWPALIV